MLKLHLTFTFGDIQALGYSVSDIPILEYSASGIQYSASGIFSFWDIQLLRYSPSATSTPTPTCSPHLLVIKNDPGVSGRPLWSTVGDITDSTAMPPQPPFQHVGHTFLSPNTTQASPVGHSGRQSLTSPTKRPCHLNLHSNT